eukprot:15365310-Ditylum_brightwellii.AAC.2
MSVRQDHQTSDDSAHLTHPTQTPTTARQNHLTSLSRQPTAKLCHGSSSMIEQATAPATQMKSMPVG